MEWGNFIGGIIVGLWIYFMGSLVFKKQSKEKK